MKRLLLSLGAVAISSTSVLSVVGCDIGEFSSLNYLRTLPDYDWVNESDGDGLDYNTKNENAVLNNEDLLIKNVDVKNGPVNDVIDYDKFSTGYKGTSFINKQAVTGAPVLKSYRPNGNTWGDYGVSSRSRKFEQVYSLMDWNKEDADLKYNASVTSIKHRNYVAKKQVDSQQKDVDLNVIHDKSNSNSSIVGTKKPYASMMTNMSYINNFVGWGWGSTNLGWLTPPNADVTEMLHKNGVPSFGLLYLSGWEDLTKEKLKKLVEKDENGSFKITDILINMCLQMNFDGWFINDEANGSSGNGSVLSNDDLYEIIREFNIKADEIYKETGNKLTLTFYQNTSSLDLDRTWGDGVDIVKDVVGKTSIYDGDKIKNLTNVQLDFYRQFPGMENKFFGDDENHESVNQSSMAAFLGLTESDRKKFSSLYYSSVTTPSIGTYDIRKYLYPIVDYDTWKNSNSKSLEVDATKKPSTSLTLYVPGNDESDYAKDVINMFMKKINFKNKNASKEAATAFIMGQEVGTLYSGYEYTGSNGYMTNSDQGADSTFNSSKIKNKESYEKAVFAAKSDEKISDVSHQDVLKLDSRISLPKDEKNSLKKDADKYDRYKYDKATGTRKYSFGYGTNFLEHTTITDSYLDEDGNEIIGNDPSMTTNFSTGSGIQFLERDSSGNLVQQSKDYPWTNNRLADTLPTYQWDFWSANSSDGVATESSDGTKYRSKITDDGQLGAYYDYYNPYKKGNSITIGNGYDMTKLENGGTVKPGQWGKGPYNFNLMGTNLQSSDYDVSFVVKSNSNSESLDEVSKATKVIVTTATGTPAETVQSKVTELKDGWYRVDASLSGITSVSKDNRIAKLGLQINPSGKNNFNFSIGEFSINSKKTEKIKDKKTPYISSINSEYIIHRDDYYNIRFNWDIENDLNIQYYSVYYQVDNKWYRVGETTQSCYFIHNLTGIYRKLKIAIKPVTTENNSNMFYGELDV